MYCRLRGLGFVLVYLLRIRLATQLVRDPLKSVFVCKHTGLRPNSQHNTPTNKKEASQKHDQASN